VQRLAHDDEMGQGVPVIPACDADHWYPGEVAASPLQHASPRAEGLACRQISLTHPVPEHQHEFYLIAFALAGSGQHEDESGRLPILAGDVCVILPGQWHAYPCVHGTLSLINLAMTGAYLLDCAPLLGEISWLGLLPGGYLTFPPYASYPAHMRLSSFELGRICPLVLALSDELEDPSASARPGIRAGLLLQILGSLGRGSRNGVHASPDEDTQDDGGILTAIHYLEERYMGPLTIEELADQTGYSATYLTRKFRQRLGMSPSDYLLTLRIRHACTLLRDTRLSIACIAGDVGFHDSHYFATRFHRLMGITPSEFRARSRTDSHTA
jgi:AraC-like DNA-binding protein